MAKKTRYSHITGRLPRANLVEPKRQDIIEETKRKILEPLRAGDEDPSWAASNVATYLGDIESARRYIAGVLLRMTAGKQHASEFASAYAKLRGIKDFIDDWSSDISLLIEAYQGLMLAQMEAEGITSLRLANGQSISTWDEPYAQVVDKEKFRQWCVANGYENQLQLWPSTVQAITKELLLAGEPEPDGVTALAMPKVRLGSE